MVAFTHRRNLSENSLRICYARCLISEAWLDRAKKFQDTGDLHKSTIACKHALALNPSNTEAYRTLSLCLKALKKYEDAISALEHILKLEPNDQSALHLLNALCKEAVSHAPIGYVEELFNRYAPPSIIA